MTEIEYFEHKTNERYCAFMFGQYKINYDFKKDCFYAISRRHKRVFTYRYSVMSKLNEEDLLNTITLQEEIRARFPEVFL